MAVKRKSQVGAIVLAAGRSTRMGEAKQLLRLGESTVLGQTLENVRGAGVDEIVLVLGFSAQTIREQLPISVTEGLKIVVNQAYEQGMASSLREGISALDPQTEAALVVLADQPFIRPETLNRLIEEHRRTHAQIVIPMYKGFRGNPVLLDRSVFPEVMALDGDIGCRAIFGSHLEGIVKVEVGDVGILLDLDSKEDFERLKHFGQGTAEQSALIGAADLEGREIPGAGNLTGGQELIIVGREPVGIALAKMAKLLKFAVTIVDPLLKISDLPDADRLLNSLDFSHLPPVTARYVVVASGGKFDEEAVEQALHTNSAYVALVANKKRAQEIRRSLELRGEKPDQLARLHAPAGLTIGA